MRSLVVDDEIVSRMKMQSILKALGPCETAEKGSRAIDLFIKAWKQWNPFDLITLDIGMPGMDGTEVLYEIKQIEKDKGVSERHRARILMVTSHSDKDSVVTSIQVGCDGYIRKPFNANMLEDHLTTLGLR